MLFRRATASSIKSIRKAQLRHIPGGSTRGLRQPRIRLPRPRLASPHRTRPSSPGPVEHTSLEREGTSNPAHILKGANSHHDLRQPTPTEPATPKGAGASSQWTTRKRWVTAGHRRRFSANAPGPQGSYARVTSATSRGSSPDGDQPGRARPRSALAEGGRPQHLQHDPRLTSRSG